MRNKMIKVTLMLALVCAHTYALAAEQGDKALSPLERNVITVPARSSNALSVSIPQTALVYRNAVPGVFVVENNLARFRMVRPGKSGARRVDILSGLFGNETLVVGDLDVVHDGSPITITNKKRAR